MIHFKISIIIPVYNVEKYIRKSLESIIRQTIGFEYLEVIMVDDCSTDKSGEIIDEYADKYENFTAIHLSENSKAAGKPRNIGMGRATSEYLMFLDPDDYYSDDACEILYEKITKYDADIVMGTFTLMDELLNERRLVHASAWKEENNEIHAHSINDHKAFLGSPPSLWAKIFKRSFICENNIRFPLGIPAQDVVFVTHAFLRANGIIFTNKVIVHYNNDRKDSLSHTTNFDILIGRMKAYYLLYDLFKENGQDEYFINHLLKNRLTYWLNKFILSDADISEKKKALEMSRPLFKIYNEHKLILSIYLTAISKLIVERQFDDAILLSDQLVYIKEKESKITRKLNVEKRKGEKLECELEKTLKQLKESQISIKKMKEDIKELSSKYDDLKEQSYEKLYLNNYNRSYTQRLISRFPSIYMLLQINKIGFKNTLINIKGYKSIKKNNLLDIGYYLKNNSDIRLSGEDPLMHYIYYGYREGRKPNPLFNGDQYYKKHGDVLDSKINPLVHYSVYGIKEERNVREK